jgi:hypothetical protein
VGEVRKNKSGFSDLGVDSNDGNVLVHARWKYVRRNGTRTGEGDPISRDVQEQVSLLKHNTSEPIRLLVGDEGKSGPVEASVEYILAPDQCEARPLSQIRVVTTSGRSTRANLESDVAKASYRPFSWVRDWGITRHIEAPSDWR